VHGTRHIYSGHVRQQNGDGTFSGALPIIKSSTSAGTSIR